MTKRTTTLIFVLIFSLDLLFIQVRAQANKDVEAIKAVITQETSAFMKVDHKAWANTWLQTPYAYWSYSDSTGTNFVEGWDKLDATFDQYFKTQKPSTARIINEWIEIRVYGTGAFVRFYQTLKDEMDLDETSQVRVLEKKSKQWKIVYVGAIAKYHKSISTTGKSSSAKK